MRYLVTGGAGFIGSHFCRLALEKNWSKSVINIDALTYAGNPRNLAAIESSADYRFVHLDLATSDLDRSIVEADPDVVVHFAAESHVDRSIDDPSRFLTSNILGTYRLLEAIRKRSKRCRFVYISTDEVYGSLGPTGSFIESTPFSPTSPYSASKASADLIASSYFHTYGMDVMIARCSNNYGPNQFPEKLIPQTIILGLEGRPIPVYGNGSNTRDWIHVEDFCYGVQVLITKGKSGEAYNFGGGAERPNLEVVRSILREIQRSETLINFVEDRKGHDFRYSMNFAKVARFGWGPSIGFDVGLRSTIAWYLANESWWRPILTGEYRKFFDRYYSTKGPATR